MSVVVELPKLIVKHIREKAEQHGISFDEYLIDLLSRDLDPSDKAIEYIEVASLLISQAKKELGKGDVRQAAEKIWRASALAIKAYAYWRDGKRLASHRELWEYSRLVAKELGEWIYDSWSNAVHMHVCFYEGWCGKEHVVKALKQIEKMVNAISNKIGIRESTSSQNIKS